MLRLFVVLTTILAVVAFNGHSPLKASRIVMSLDKKLMKSIGTAFLAGSLLGGASVPTFAKEGAAAKIGIFTNNDMSSPFAAGENREDPLYSPYSPYGNGEKAIYNNQRKGSADELKFWKNKFDDCSKRVEKIPGYVSKKTWTEITTELTRGLYSYREAMLRLARAAPNPAAAEAAAKKYFSDLEDIYVFATKKNPDVVLASYEQSVEDLKAYKALLSK